MADTARPVAGPRFGAVTAWAGTEVLVVGGTDDAGGLVDGAAYDPSTDSWRTIPHPPDALDAVSIGVWTGEELLVWSGNAPGRSDPPGLTWRPPAD